MQTQTQLVLTFKCLHLNLASFGIQTARRLHKQVPSEKAYISVAFTVNDSADPIFFAGPETDSRCHNDMSGDQDPRRKLFLFVSGQTAVGAPASFDPVKPVSSQQSQLLYVASRSIDGSTFATLLWVTKKLLNFPKAHTSKKLLFTLRLPSSGY